MKITESPSHYEHLERMSTAELLRNMNTEDRSVPAAVSEVLPAMEVLVDAIAERMQRGGRLFYLGAGTSGRLGIVDASECPPTFGVPHGLVIGLIAGAMPPFAKRSNSRRTTASKVGKTYRNMRSVRTIP